MEGFQNVSLQDLNMSSDLNDSASGSQAYIFEQSWGWWLLQIGSPIILLVGLPGNVLSILVLKSRRFRGKSYIHYLVALAVFDSLVLIMKYTRRVDSLIEALGYDAIFSRYGDVACKIHNFAEHLFYLMSSWLVLCMTLERYIATVFPFKRDTFCKPRSAITTIIFVFIVMCDSQIFRLVIIEKGQYTCTAPERYLEIYVAMHIYMYQLVLQFMLPALVIMICNITILYKIRKLRYRINRGHGDTKTTGTLLIVSFTYVVTLLPLVLLSMAVHLAVKINPIAARYMLYNLNDLRYVLELLSEINFGVNFYIYVLSGAQFQYQLRHIMSKSSLKSSGQTEKVFQFRRI